MSQVDCSRLQGQSNNERLFWELLSRVWLGCLWKRIYHEICWKLAHSKMLGDIVLDNKNNFDDDVHVFQVY